MQESVKIQDDKSILYVFRSPVHSDFFAGFSFPKGDSANVEELMESSAIRGDITFEYAVELIRAGNIRNSLHITDDGKKIYALPQGVIKDALLKSLMDRIIPGFSEGNTVIPTEIIDDIFLDIAPESMEALKDTSYHFFARKTLSLIRLLSSGDVEARRQVLRSLPLLTDTILNNKHFLRHVDDRLPIMEAFQNDEVFGLSKTEAIHLLNIFKLIKPSMKMNNISLSEALGITKLIRKGESIKTITDVHNAFAGWRMSNTKYLYTIPNKHLDMIVKDKPLCEWGEIEKKLMEMSSSLGDYKKYVGNTIYNGIFDEILTKRAPTTRNLAQLGFEKVMQNVSPTKYEISALRKVLSVFSATRNSRNSAIENIWETVCDSVSLKRLGELDQRWHHQQGVLRERSERITEDFSWKPFVGMIDAGEGYRAREMSSNSDLKTQGRKEQHCVGGYTNVITSVSDDQITLIFSIEKDEQILSTVELELSPREGVKIKQHSAKNNTKPSSIACNVSDILAKILEPLIKIRMKDYVRDMENNSAELKRELLECINRQGVNIFEAGVAVQSYTESLPVLPAALRSMSLGDWNDRLPDFDIEISDDNNMEITNEYA